jgi:nickel superoxide dismutase
MQKTLLAIICLISFSFISNNAQAHCEVPCGIYGDSVRVKLIYEHIATIEKAMNNIDKESKNAKPNYNQLVRWVNNKEIHAEKIQQIVSQYFLHQRVKPVSRQDGHAYSHYVQKLELLHRISVLSMKTKQSTDQKNITMLRATVAQFEKAYFTHSH